MKIRDAVFTDAPAIAKLHADSWRNNYQNALSEYYLLNIAPKERSEIWHSRLGQPKANQKVIVAETNGNVVGFVCVYFGENAEWGSYLDNLHVHKTYQSKGIGQTLVSNAALWCYQQDKSKGMCLLVNQNNIKAQEFYKKLGARNAKIGIWNAPDGSDVPTYWFVWDSLEGFC